jgi:2-C-methyl-D-erythritol 4-phosphate cytidylyltransferase
VEGTEPRQGLALAQTPQAFLASALRDAHARAERDAISVTDDAAALELAGYRVRAVAGEAGNFKITTIEDLARAEAAVADRVDG